MRAAILASGIILGLVSASLAVPVAPLPDLPKSLQVHQVNYKSAEKYIGSDTLDLLVLLPGGFAQEVHINMDVR